MARVSGSFINVTTLSETVRAFVPHALPPAEPPLAPASYDAQDRAAEVALARLSAVSGLVPSVEWLLYSAVRREALLTSQIEGTQATLIDLFDQEAGVELTNRDDVEEVTNYMRAFRMVRDNLRDVHGLPLSVRFIGYCSMASGAPANNQASCAAPKTGSAAAGPVTRHSSRRHLSIYPGC